MTVMGHQSFFETEKSPQTRMNTKKNVPDSKIRHIIWWEKVDSNPRPADYKSAALPAELHQRVSLTLEYYIIFEKICQGKSGKYFIIPLFPISAIFPAFPQHDYPAFFGTSQGHHRRFLWRDDDFGW